MCCNTINSDVVLIVEWSGLKDSSTEKYTFPYPNLPAWEIKCIITPSQVEENGTCTCTVTLTLGRDNFLILARLSLLSYKSARSKLFLECFQTITLSLYSSSKSTGDHTCQRVFNCWTRLFSHLFCGVSPTCRSRS